MVQPFHLQALVHKNLYKEVCFAICCRRSTDRLWHRYDPTLSKNLFVLFPMNLWDPSPPQQHPPSALPNWARVLSPQHIGKILDFYNNSIDQTSNTRSKGSVHIHLHAAAVAATCKLVNTHNIIGMMWVYLNRFWRSATSKGDLHGSQLSASPNPCPQWADSFNVSLRTSKYLPRQRSRLPRSMLQYWPPSCLASRRLMLGSKWGRKLVIRAKSSRMSAPTRPDKNWRKEPYQVSCWQSLRSPLPDKTLKELFFVVRMPRNKADRVKAKQISLV